MASPSPVVRLSLPRAWAPSPSPSRPFGNVGSACRPLSSRSRLPPFASSSSSSLSSSWPTSSSRSTRSATVPLSTASSAQRPRGFATSSRLHSADVAAAETTSLPETASAVSQNGFALLEPWVPTLHSLAETLHITGPSSHALSIFALAFAVRTIFTLPMTLWQRKRTRRMVELVVPEWQAYKRKAPELVRARCRKAGKSYEEFQQELQADLKAQIRNLMKQHKCSPIPSFLGPLAVHLPVFFALSALIRQAALEPGSPFSSELLPWWSPSPEVVAQFKTTASILADRGMDEDMIAKLQGTQGGPTLAVRDNTMIGPVSLGMLTMTNVELTSWSRKAMAKLTSLNEAADSGGTKPVKAAADGPEEEDEPRRTRVLTNAFRVLAIASIPIASQAPGALIIYWLSSGVYTLMQNSIFAFIDRQREAKKLLQPARLVKR